MVTINQSPIISRRKNNRILVPAMSSPVIVSSPVTKRDGDVLLYMNSVSNTERYVKPDEKTNIVITAEPISECRNDSFAVAEENTQSQVYYVTQWGVSAYPEKNSYEGVWFNVISITKGWVGVKLPGKRRYVTLERPLWWAAPSC